MLEKIGDIVEIAEIVFYIIVAITLVVALIILLCGNDSLLKFLLDLFKDNF